ncbi:S-protein homolog 1 [Linum grandiflorum]
MKASSLPTLVVVIVATLVLVGTRTTSAFSLWPYKHVHVINELNQSWRHLFLQCWSKDDDLGTHEVPVWSEYTWRFKPNVLGTTTWTCSVRLNDGRHAQWDSYWEDLSEGKREYKDNIYWVAEEDGIYLRYKKENRDEFYAKWRTN